MHQKYARHFFHSSKDFSYARLLLVYDLENLFFKTLILVMVKGKSHTGRNLVNTVDNRFYRRRLWSQILSPSMMEQTKNIEKMGEHLLLPSSFSTFLWLLTCFLKLLEYGTIFEKDMFILLFFSTKFSLTDGQDFSEPTFAPNSTQRTSERYQAFSGLFNMRINIFEY